MKKFSSLPNGKSHVSFSELSNWVECSWAYKKKYIEQIDLDQPGWGSSFGTIVHNACEKFLHSKIMDIDPAITELRNSFDEHKFVDRDENLIDVEPFVIQMTNILQALPEWFNETFPDWKCVDAEHFLYERLVGYGDDDTLFFKGFIDCIVEITHRGKKIVWIIDFKTSGWGWDRDKRCDETTKQQLILYKHYYCKKKKLELRNVRCGFVILKRTAKPGTNCELIPVSVGDVTTNRALNVIDDMIVSMSRGMFLKNKESCKFCPYKKTEHCPGTNCV